MNQTHLHSPVTAGRLKKGTVIVPRGKPQGMTLIEILVSMLVLGLGVLVLLATQLRTVVGVREAEQQTIVSQAVQNLIEGMLANPTLVAGTGLTRKNYDRYANALQGIDPATCTDAMVGAITATGATIQTKDQLMRSQLCQFRQTIANHMPDATINATICTDNSGVTPTVAGNAVNWQCDGNGTNTVIKVLWQTETANDANIANSVVMNDNNAVYTYQARIMD